VALSHARAQLFQGHIGLFLDFGPDKVIILHQTARRAMLAGQGRTASGLTPTPPPFLNRGLADPKRFGHLGLALLAGSHCGQHTVT
jgi:hypothetical protein